jgi:hypothetical protein
MHSAQQPRDSIQVISMEMSDENAVYAIPFDTGAHQLKLCSFAAIE